MPIQIKASFFYLFCTFFQKGISVLTTPIFTRLFSAEEYGQFGVFYSWYSILSIFLTLSLFQGVHTQGLIKFSEDKYAFNSSLQGLVTFLIICFSIIYFLFQSFFNKLLALSTMQFIFIFILSWTHALFCFFANSERVVYKYKFLAIITVASTILKPILGIIFVYFSKDKVNARIISFVIIEFLFFSWLFFYNLSKSKKLFSKKYWLYAIAFNLPLIPHYLSLTVLSGADKIMIKNIIGDAEAGIYNLSYSISMVMSLFNSSLSSTLSPWFYNKIKYNKIKDVEKIAYISLLIIASVNLLLIIFAPEIVYIFAPKTYHDAIWIIPPVCMSLFFTFSYDLFAKFAFYYEKTKIIMTISVIGALLNIGLNYLFLPIFGYFAAGYTTFFCYFIFALLNYLYMFHICKKYCNNILPYNHSKIIIISICFILTGFLFMFLYNYIILRIICIFIILIILFINRNKIKNIFEYLFKIKK